jgi:YVTN family beta-propeller protein
VLVVVLGDFTIGITEQNNCGTIWLFFARKRQLIGGSACVTNAGSNSVSVINTSTNAVTATVPVGTTPVNAATF